jgi:hypothetical protein
MSPKNARRFWDNDMDKNKNFKDARPSVSPWAEGP